MRIDRSDDGDERPDTADVPEVRGPTLDGTPARTGTSRARTPTTGRKPGAPTGWRGTLSTGPPWRPSDRAYAIDQGYARVQEIEEKTVTPAMRRIEAEDPDRHLAGLENRLKGKDRLTEKITEAVEERGHTVSEAFGLVKDAIRYTFCYPDDRYTDGVYSGLRPARGCRFRALDRRNSWERQSTKESTAGGEFPGVSNCSRFSSTLKRASRPRRRPTAAYERLRSLPEDDEEVRELHAYQREVTAKVPIPPGAPEIPDYP